VRPQTDIERDLARLADGTLPPERARELEARVAESAELSALLAEQRAALDAVTTLGDRAPAALRSRVESLRARSAPRQRAKRYGFAGALAAAAACVAIALVAILPTGAGGPTLSQAAAFTLKPSAGPAPSHSFDGALDLDVDGVPYPYWKDDLGWTAVGSRVDKIDGREATTVFYRKGARRVGYTIVTGKPVSMSGSATVTVRDGIRFRTVPLHGTTVLTWERRGHSCILAGRNLTRAQLLKLAAWKDAGELPYSGHS
jgi:hypothetical protein